MKDEGLFFGEFYDGSKYGFLGVILSGLVICSFIFCCVVW